MSCMSDNTCFTSRASAPKRLRETGTGCQRVKADRHQKRALELVAAGQSYREVALRLGISKNTVLDIVKRDRAKQATITG